MSTRFSEHVVIRMPAELRQQIEAAAEAEARPISNLVRLALADWLKQRASERRAAA
jgi:predicted DNA-binding protein